MSWEYDDRGAWTPFSPIHMSFIERHYVRDQNAQFPIRVGNTYFIIDLKQFTNTNIDTKAIYNLRRVCPKGFILTKGKTPTCWFYVDDSGNLQQYADQYQQVLEDAYQDDPLSSTQLKIGSYEYVIDFCSMTQVNKTTKTTRCIERLGSSPLSVGDFLSKHLKRLPQRSPFTSVTIPTIPLYAFDTATDFQSIITPTPLSECKEDDQCPICWCEFIDPDVGDDEQLEVVQLPCGHRFHESCGKTSFSVKGSCPMCKQQFIYSAGPQPNGSCEVSYSCTSCDGNAGVGSIHMIFSLQAGVQDYRHPNPGLRFGSDVRVHYMPATPTGFRVLRLLVKAFMIRVLFDVGHSYTRNVDNVIIYGPIHLKSSQRGGSAQHAWPDDDYFVNVLAELKQAGVVDDTS